MDDQKIQKITAATTVVALVSLGLYAYRYLSWRHQKINQKLDYKLGIKEDKWLIINQNPADRPTFHVMTYNILAECYLQPKKLASEARNDPLHHWLALTDFEYRANRIIRQIGERILSGKPMPDIIGFQEVDESKEDFWRSRLEVLGYEVKFDFHPGADGTAIAWLQRKFSLKQYKEVNFADQARIFDKEVFNINMNGQIALFEHHQLQKQIVFVNTHFHWNPKEDYVKYANAYYMLLNLQQFLNENHVNPEFSPVVFVGDFNSEPHGSATMFLMGKQYKIPKSKEELHTDPLLQKDADKHYHENSEAARLFKVVKDFIQLNGGVDQVQSKFDSAYSKYHQIDQDTEDKGFEYTMAYAHPRVTNQTAGWSDCIDHILYMPKTLKLLKILKVPEKEDLYVQDDYTAEIEKRDLPNRLHPSDHLRLEAVFEFLN